MFDILFQIIINPIYVLIEFLYNFFLKVCNFNQTFSIIALSLAVNFLWLPMYLNADKLKLEDDEIKKKLKKKKEIIKKNFKGEEKFLILRTFYKQNNYNPLNSIKALSSLFLQMIFFVAAYLFFTKNIPSEPDAFLQVFNYKINLAPVIMTLISLISGYFYQKNHKEARFGVYFLPLLFLILLYNAPFALVLYWIVNNIFSVFKNVILNFLMTKKNPCTSEIYESGNFVLYFLVCVCFWLLVGLLAPANVIASASVKFFNIYPYSTPFAILLINLVKTFGIFVFWGGVVYAFTSQRFKNILVNLLVCLFYCFLLNYLLIEYPYGEVTNAMEFTNYIGSKILPFSYYLIFSFVLGIVIFLLFKNKEIIKKSLIIFILCAITAAIYDVREIILTGKKIPEQNSEFDLVYNFSKEKKNVLIIFLDKAIGSYFPLILKENPELKQEFDGFTFYPNTVSFAAFTRLAYPALIGGYDYTPLKLDYDKKRLLKEKYNEALFVLPEIFQKNGFNVTVTDAPWGDFEFITDKKMFEEKNINYDNIQGKYSNLYKKKYLKSEDDKSLEILSRNLLYFSFMKVSPIQARDFIIDDNKYLNSAHEEIKYTNDLLASYSALYFLSKLTKFDSKKPAFIIINNELTHNADCFLDSDYKLTFNPVLKQPFNPPFELNRYSLIHYHSNAAGIRLVAAYLKFLKQNGVFDNTRIIIVSDHGAKALKNPFLDKKVENNVVRFNPLLLVKDFSQKGALKTSNEFMSNADTAYLALRDIVENPINLFSKNLIKPDKNQPLVIVNYAQKFVLKDKRTTPFDDKKIKCIKVQKDIFKHENWIKISDKELEKLRNKIKE